MCSDIKWDLHPGLWPSEPATRIFDLELERDAYRDLLQATLTALQNVTQERDRLRAQLRTERQRLKDAA
jgi:hypothetical protein